MDTINFIISLFVWISLSAKQIHTAATEAAKRQKYNDLLYNHHFQPVLSRPLVCMISLQPFFQQPHKVSLVTSVATLLL